MALVFAEMLGSFAGRRNFLNFIRINQCVLRLQSLHAAFNGGPEVRSTSEVAGERCCIRSLRSSIIGALLSQYARIHISHVFPTCRAPG